jgi:ATP-dependent RNA/DNA helicase IGHMBP2
MHPSIQNVLYCLDLEIKEQEKKYKLDQHNSLKALKSEGLAMHPIRVNRKTFGYADYPEISFRLPYPTDTTNFREGCSIECFCEGEEPVKGLLLQLVGAKGEFRLFTSDFPDWLEEEGVGIKLSPDHRTVEVMKDAVKNIEDNVKSRFLYEKLHGNSPWDNRIDISKSTLELSNVQLNVSQKNAVHSIVSNENLVVVHGPPGTGKTTTLVEGILQLIHRKEKVVVSAPTNAAVDHIARGLLQEKIKVLRVGNTSKVDERVFPHTTEGRMLDNKYLQEVKNLKIRAEQLRKMAYQYKRNFGKEEREQRHLLLKEVKNIRKEIRDLRGYFEEILFKEADVVIGTPLGVHDFNSQGYRFDTLILDEAGQCIEPLAWILIPLAKKWVLAGDHLQLPPLVFSEKAAGLGLGISILETSFAQTSNSWFLNTQYRMRAAIAGFSSQYFYNNELIAAEGLHNIGSHITFYDTAGAGFEELSGSDGSSLINQGELDIVQKIIDSEKLDPKDIAIISPYSGQVNLARSFFPPTFLVSTIDSFQGQEKEVVILSLVRSNTESKIGFLSDYRRMNVALTRAKEKLFVIGDSATIGNDPFYSKFLEYMENHQGYRSVWELL